MSHSTPNIRKSKKKLGRPPGRFRLLTCPHCGKKCKGASGLAVHVMNKHEGKTWSRRLPKKPHAPPPPTTVLEVPVIKDHREPVVIRSVGDLKYCPECGTGLGGYRTVGTVNWCPVCGFSLPSFVKAVQFMEGVGSGRKKGEAAL